MTPRIAPLSHDAPSFATPITCCDSDSDQSALRVCVLVGGASVGKEGVCERNENEGASH
jgi:hypothetical protein